MILLDRLRKSNFQNIATYGVATCLAALLTLIITRLLWRALSPADFGLWSLIDPSLLPAASLVLLGIDHAIVKQFRVDGISLRLAAGTLLMTTVPLTALCLAGAGLVSQFVFHLDWTGAFLLTMLGEALILMMQTSFRAGGMVYGFAALLVSRNLLYLAALLIVEIDNQPAQLALGPVFLVRGACVILVSSVALVGFRPLPVVNWARYRDAVRYGFPLLVTTFIFALTDMIDRWFLAAFTGIAAVGVYAIHLKVAGILSQAIVIPFGLWFPPERFKRMRDPDGGNTFFIRTALALTLICAYLCGVVWLSRNFLLSLIAPGVVASPFVLACCLAGVTCLALSQALNVGLLLPGHTGKNVTCTIYAVAASLVGCAALVPPLGVAGAAISRGLAAFVLLCATAISSTRVYHVAFPFATMSLCLGGSAATVVGLDQAAASFHGTGLSLALVAWTAITAVALVFLRTRLWQRVAATSLSAG